MAELDRSHRAQEAARRRRRSGMDTFTVAGSSCRGVGMNQEDNAFMLVEDNAFVLILLWIFHRHSGNFALSCLRVVPLG